MALKIYSLRKLQVYDAVLFTVVSMPCITSPGLTNFITGSFYFGGRPSTTADNPQSVLCVQEDLFFFFKHREKRMKTNVKSSVTSGSLRWLARSPKAWKPPQVTLGSVLPLPRLAWDAWEFFLLCSSPACPV